MTTSPEFEGAGNSNPFYRVVKVPGDKGLGSVATQDLVAGQCIVR